MISPWWLCASYLFQTTGELLISPIGLAMITVLSPKKYVGMMMGIWFLAQAASFSIGGYLANFAANPVNTSLTHPLGIYTHAFLINGAISVVAALFCLLLVPFLTSLTKEG